MLNCLKKTFPWLLLLVTICGFSLFRIISYGDPGTSIGTVDTSEFISSAQVDLDCHFLEAGRPPTLPLLYKLLHPVTGYDLTAVSMPSAADGLKELQWQPDFSPVVRFQMILSILAWSSLAVVLFYRLRTLVGKFTVALFILAFAYSPQLAEWDRILLSESVSFSLFAFLLALTIELAFRCSEVGYSSNLSLYLVGISWFIVFVLWVFARDANAYLIPVTVIMLFIIFMPGFPRRRKLPIVIGLGLLLSACFYLQQMTMRASQRWVLPFLTNISVNVLPYPDRVDLFRSMGMPVSDELMHLQSSMGGEAGFYKLDDFMDWTEKNGTKVYTRFLMEYPLWATSKLYNDLELLFSENLQPWFSGPKDSHPSDLIRIGDMLHPKTSGVILLDVFFTIIIMFIAFRSRDADSLTWLWITMWLFIGEMVLLFISYHGDARSTIRHTLVATMPLRLSIWLLAILVFDMINYHIGSKPR